MPHLQAGAPRANQPALLAPSLLPVLAVPAGPRISNVRASLPRKIETKYRIICPACTQKTVFYDLRHLILEGHRSNDEEYFVTDRYLSKPEIKAPLRHNNYISSENNSQPITRRGSIHSIANTGTINSIVNNNKSMLEVKCLDHGEPYKYFCSDCCGKPAKNVLLCCECAKPHYNGGHRLLSLRQSEAKLLRLNMDSKDEMVSRQG